MNDLVMPTDDIVEVIGTTVRWFIAVGGAMALIWMLAFLVIGWERMDTMARGGGAILTAFLFQAMIGTTIALDRNLPFNPSAFVGLAAVAGTLVMLFKVTSVGSEGMAMRRIVQQIAALDPCPTPECMQLRARLMRLAGMEGKDLFVAAMAHTHIDRPHEAVIPNWDLGHHHDHEPPPQAGGDPSQPA